MIALVQRVAKASVTVEGELIAGIDQGLLILLGIARDDDEAAIARLTRKTVQLRIFNDGDGVMNWDVKQVGGDILLVSQFTLQANTKKGNRPSYVGAAPPEQALPLYQKTIIAMEEQLGKPIQTGRFGALMQVSLINDGPTTLIIDTKK